MLCSWLDVIEVPHGWRIGPFPFRWPPLGGHKKFDADRGTPQSAIQPCSPRVKRQDGVGVRLRRLRHGAPCNGNWHAKHGHLARMASALQATVTFPFCNASHLHVSSTQPGFSQLCDWASLHLRRSMVDRRHRLHAAAGTWRRPGRSANATSGKGYLVEKGGVQRYRLKCRLAGLFIGRTSPPWLLHPECWAEGRALRPRRRSGIRPSPA